MIRFRKLYEELLRRLDPYQLESPDQLSKTVVPVAIVEDLSIIEIPLTILGNGLYSGNTAAAAPTTVVDTGALPAGTYEGEFYCRADANAQVLDLEHRNAANGANLDIVRVDIGQYTAGGPKLTVMGPHFSVALALNERLRIQLVSRSAGLDRVDGTIVLRKTS